MIGIHQFLPYSRFLNPTMPTASQFTKRCSSPKPGQLLEPFFCRVEQLLPRRSSGPISGLMESRAIQILSSKVSGKWARLTDV